MEKVYPKEQFIKSISIVAIATFITIIITSLIISNIKKDIKLSVEVSSKYFTEIMSEQLVEKFTNKRINFLRAKDIIDTRNIDLVNSENNKIISTEKEIKKVSVNLKKQESELKKKGKLLPENEQKELQNKIDENRNTLKKLTADLPTYKSNLKVLTQERVNKLKELGYNKKNLKHINDLSLDAIAIWGTDEGKIQNFYHTYRKFYRKNIYGLRDNEEIDSKNINTYFKMKIENEVIAEEFNKINDFYIENLEEILNLDTREQIHSLRKFIVNGEEFLIDFQYSKRSILETRMTKSIQKLVIIAMFLYVIFLWVYSIIFDKNLFTHVIVWTVLLYTLYPVTWVISLTFSGVNSLGGTTLNPIPKKATLDNYRAALFNLKRVKVEAVKLENGKLYIGEEIVKTDVDAKPMLEAKNIISVYNAFDPTKTNLYEKAGGKLETEQKSENTKYNGEIKTIVRNVYYVVLNEGQLDKNYQKIYNIEYYTYQNTLFVSGMRNSIFISIATALIGMILSSSAAYAFSRFRFPGRDGLMMSFLITQMFPNIMMLIPLYIIFGNLGLINTFRGLILAYSITALPFNIWNLKGYFDTVPVDLEEAALIDGCSASQTFWKIVMPLSLPSLAISGLFSFLAAWNEYVVAATFVNEEGKYTIPVVIRMLVGSNSVNWPLFGAMSVLVSIPVVAVFLLTQKYLVGGLTAGGVKG